MNKLLILTLAPLMATPLAGRVPGNDTEKQIPTFTKNVAPILFNKCAVCHRPGEVAPMPLLSYQDARPWAKAIREEVLELRMPPWFAHPDYGKFRNDRRLSPREIDTIVSWVNAGAPKGDDGDLPPIPRFAPGWTLGEPEMVIPMPVEFEVPAEGQIDYQYFYVPIPFTEDRFVEAVELRPGNPSVVHHSIVNTSKVSEENKHKLTSGKKIGEMQWKPVGQAPGKGAEAHRPGIAKRLSPGLYFEFNIHYSPTGRREKDRSMLGLWFSKGPVTYEVITKTVSDAIFVDGRPVTKKPSIPAYADNWEIVGHMPVKEDITL